MQDRGWADSSSLIALTFQGWDFPACLPPRFPFPGSLELCSGAWPWVISGIFLGWQGWLPADMTARLLCPGVGGLNKALLFSLWEPWAVGGKPRGRTREDGGHHEGRRVWFPKSAITTSLPQTPLLFMLKLWRVKNTLNNKSFFLSINFVAGGTMLIPLQSWPDLDCRMILWVTLFKQVAFQGLLKFILMLASQGAPLFPLLVRSVLKEVCWVGKQVL